MIVFPLQDSQLLVACSEIIPFKLDLDNSSAKDYCYFMMPPSPICWHAD